MTILTTTGWADYQLLDSGNGRRLERFGKYIISRPDPQIIWKQKLGQEAWDKVDAYFKRIRDDKGVWVEKHKLPESWKMQYKGLNFSVRLTPFKHTGVFPEQSVQWDWIREKIAAETTRRADQSSGQSTKLGQVNILNLFAYTGLASLAAAAAGAKVTHLDASRPAITWARENQMASSLQDKPIRWMLDDALKFTEREIKRGVRYDGIIMDPPVYGHGPKGERWDFNTNFPILMRNCAQLLSAQPLFLLVNAYAISSSAIMLQNVIGDYLQGRGGQVDAGELVIQEQGGGRLLSTGIFGRWEK